MNKINNNLKSVIVCLLVFLLLGAAVLYYVNSADAQKKEEELVYSDIVDLFADGKVSYFELDLATGALEYKLFSDPDNVQKYSVKGVSYFLEDIRPSVNEFNEQNPDNQIKFNYKASSTRSWLVNLGPVVLSIVSLVLIGFILIRRMTSSMNSETTRSLGFGKVRAKVAGENGDVKTFEDVAGCDEEKEELVEIVEFLKNPQRFTELGARIPKGVLLVGPPGTGKTLLAKAVAGEADVPFLSISGSDFVEMYVGVGASRVRDLFSQAMKKAPAIVFIDEIDAVGRHRGTGMGNGNDEREQTLNQLLVEMDGFGTNSGVIIMAGTNRPDVLDPALLRPGRFDRRIMVNRPDMRGREDILKVHAKNKPLAPDVDLKKVAQNTSGFVGADLENLLNEAALLAARKHRHAITYQDILDAGTKVLMGTEKKSHKYTEKAKRLTAYHESGHAVTSFYLENHNPVQEISIIPRGLGAGGYTLYREEEENYDSKNDILDLIISMLGGRVAEAISLDDISTGASNDLQRATQLCRDMVAKYGMSESIGPVVYSDESSEFFLGRDFGHVNNYSEATSAKIDAEIEKMMRDAYEKTKQILTEHNDKLVLVAETLLEREKISGVEFESLMTTGALPPVEEPQEEPIEESSLEEAPLPELPAETAENTADAEETTIAEEAPSTAISEAEAEEANPVESPEAEAESDNTENNE